MNRIRETREAAGISQAELYKKLGWRQSRLANYETGNRRPGLNDAREIIAALEGLGVACELDKVFPQPQTSKSVPSHV
ncbi:helix-turn-helix transcriptional regulator [Aquipseudomonas alcaligenes]